VSYRIRLLILGMVCSCAPALAQRAGAQIPEPYPAATAAADNSSTSGQAAKALTREEAEAIALRNNPQITIGKLQALEALQYVRETRSALLPTAFLSLTGVDSEAGSRIAAGGLTNPIVFPRAATGATVSQLITDFGRSASLLSSSEFQAKAEDKNAAATVADITLAVDQAFYNSLETRELVKVAQQTVSARQVLVDKIQALTNAKLKSDLDLSFAKVDLARGKLLVLEALNNYQTSLATLSAILGYPDEQNFQLIDPTEQLTPPAPEAQPLILQALQQRPEAAALQYQVASAQKNSIAEHDLWRPTVNALGVVGIAPVRDPAIPNWYGAVGVNINIPVFNGFLYNARAKTADLQTEVARQKLADLRNSIARDVRISWQDTNRAYERLSVTQQLREQANLALDLAQARYNLGLGSIVEFSQAELGKTEADIADTDAKFQYRLTQIVLAYTIAAPK
jgi:outer membrane protein